MRVLCFVLLFILLTTALSNDVAKVKKSNNVKWTKILGEVHKIIRKLPRDLQAPASMLVFRAPKFFENLLKSKNSFLQNPVEVFKMVGLGFMDFVSNLIEEGWLPPWEEVEGDVKKLLMGLSGLARLENEISSTRSKLPQIKDVDLEKDVAEAVSKIKKDLPKLWKSIQRKMPKALVTDTKVLQKILPDEKQVRQILYSLLTTLEAKLPNLEAYKTQDIFSHLKDFQKHAPDALTDIVKATSQALATLQRKFPDMSDVTITGKTIRVHLPVLVKQAVETLPNMKSVKLDEQKLQSEVRSLLAQVENGLPGLIQSWSAKFPDLSQWKPESLPDVVLEIARWIGDLLIGGPARLPDMSQLSKEKQGGVMKTLFASAGTKLKFIAHNINQHLTDGIQYVKENLPQPKPDRNEL
ncbi:uncharacterized protein LOC144907881 [Branchiostoma floridae x Branchiostoma belcheri]